MDDEASILLAIDTTLQMAGLNNTITCQDSRRVMDLLTDSPIEAMLLDLNMPNIDGHRLLDDVRREYPDVPVIIVTGAVDVETAVRCIKAGGLRLYRQAGGSGPADHGREPGGLLSGTPA